MKLYIIGNGFDRAHGLKTSYWDFRCYLNRYAKQFLVEFEKLYGHYPFDPDEYHVPKSKQKELMKRRDNALNETMWKTFEESIGNPEETEFDTICDSTIAAMKELDSGPIGIEDTLNLYFEEQFGFVKDLQNYLLKWAKKIELKNASIKKDSLKNNTTDFFLTFNYTPTLECVYGIPVSHICHIHGGIPPYCSHNPVIGHGNRESIMKWKKWKDENDILFDEGGSSKCRAIVNFYSRTFKDTEQMIGKHMDFFHGLQRIEEVIVIGHSFGKVDIPYFEKIVEINGKDTPWTILYYSSTEKDSMERIVRTLGIKNVNMTSSIDYWDR